MRTPLMPRRLCSIPGCAGTVTYRGRCQAHARLKERDTNRAGRHIYNTAKWKHTRKRVLFEQPLCKCGEIAVDVDHIVPLPEGDPYAMSNLQGLCKQCHGRKTRIETFGVGWPE